MNEFFVVLADVSTYIVFLLAYEYIKTINLSNCIIYINYLGRTLTKET